MPKHQSDSKLEQPLSKKYKQLKLSSIILKTKAHNTLLNEMDDVEDEIVNGLDHVSQKVRKRLKSFQKQSSQSNQTLIRKKNEVLQILENVDLRDAALFPTITELKQYDPSGVRLIRRLDNSCDGYHYNERFCEFIAKQLVELAKENTININTKDIGGLTILHSLAKKKRINLIKILLSIPGININIQDDNRLTPLHHLVKFVKDHNLVFELIDLGADVSSKDIHGCNVFAYACNFDNFQIAQALLGKKLELIINKNTEQDIYKLWFTGARKGNLNILKLLSRYVDINKKNLEGSTALHHACEGACSDLVEYLLKLPNIEINTKNNTGYTPLVLAAICEEFDPKIIRLFLNKNIDPNERLTTSILTDNDKTKFFQEATLLHILAYRGEYHGLKYVLKHTRVDINSKDKKGMTALHYAALADKEDIVAKLLLNPTINLVIENNNGETALELSKRKSHQIVAEMIQNEINKRHTFSYFFNNTYGRFLVNKIDVTYGGKYESAKDVTISTNLRHENMRLRGLLAQKQRDNLGNFLTASLSFVVSQKDSSSLHENPRFSIDLDIEPPIAYVHVKDLYQDNINEFLSNILYRYHSAPERVKQEAVSIPCDNKPLNDKGIETIINNKEAFYRRFHHSEQALHEYLEKKENVASIVERLLNKLQASNFLGKVKIHFAILDIYSTNSLCPDCLITTLGQQNPDRSKFLLFLTEQLREKGFDLPKFSKLRLLTRVNADQLSYSKSIEQRKIEKAPIDLRNFDGTWLIEHDALSEKPVFSAFVSRNLK